MALCKCHNLRPWWEIEVWLHFSEYQKNYESSTSAAMALYSLQISLGASTATTTVALNAGHIHLLSSRVRTPAAVTVALLVVSGLLLLYMWRRICLVVPSVGTSAL